MVSLNNRHMGTVSQKLKRVVPIKNYIAKKIDDSQEIKRLARYMTVTPLMAKGKSYDGKMIVQEDLTDSLMGYAENDKGASIRDQVLYNYAFNEDVLEEKRLTIYVHSPRSTFNLNMANNNSYRGVDDYTGRHIFFVEVVYPIMYNEIQPFGNERAMSIACEIANLFDNLSIEEELEGVGFCELNIEGEVLDARLSTSGYMCVMIPIATTVFTRRTFVK